MEDFGRIIAEQVQRVDWGRGEAWERVLRLHLKPKPDWMPTHLWARIVSLVLVQSVEGQ